MGTGLILCVSIIVTEDVAPFDPSADDVVQRNQRINACFSWHEVSMSCMMKPGNAQTQHRPSFRINGSVMPCPCSPFISKPIDGLGCFSKVRVESEMKLLSLFFGHNHGCFRTDLRTTKTRDTLALIYHRIGV